MSTGNPRPSLTGGKGDPNKSAANPQAAKKAQALRSAMANVQSELSSRIAAITRARPPEDGPAAHDEKALSAHRAAQTRLGEHVIEHSAHFARVFAVDPLMAEAVESTLADNPEEHMAVSLALANPTPSKPKEPAAEADVSEPGGTGIDL